MGADKPRPPSLKKSRPVPSFSCCLLCTRKIKGRLSLCPGGQENLVIWETLDYINHIDFGYCCCFLLLSFSSTYLTPHVRSRSERSKQWVAHKQARAVWCAIHRPKQLLYYALLLLLHAARGGGGASVAAALNARAIVLATAAACTGLNLTVFWQQAVREDGAFTLKVLNSVYNSSYICFYYES